MNIYQHCISHCGSCKDYKQLYICRQCYKQLQAENERLKEVIWAKDQLLISYRVGKSRVSEKVFAILDKYGKAQKALEEK